MDLPECIAGLDEDGKAFVNEVDELLTGLCRLKIVEKDEKIRLTYTDNVTKRALVAFAVTGALLNVHLYANNIGRYVDELLSMPDAMLNIIKNGRECDGIEKHPTCIGPYCFTMDGNEFKKCRYMNFRFDDDKDNRTYLKSMIMNEMSSR